MYAKKLVKFSSYQRSLQCTINVFIIYVLLQKYVKGFLSKHNVLLSLYFSKWILLCACAVGFQDTISVYSFANSLENVVSLMQIDKRYNQFLVITAIINDNEHIKFPTSVSPKRKEKSLDTICYINSIVMVTLNVVALRR